MTEEEKLKKVQATSLGSILCKTEEDLEEYTDIAKTSNTEEMFILYFESAIFSRENLKEFFKSITSDYKMSNSGILEKSEINLN